MKKIKSFLIASVMLCLVLTGCNETESKDRRNKNNASKDMFTITTTDDSVDKIETSVTTQSKYEKPTTESKTDEKTVADRNKNIKVSMMEYEDFDSEKAFHDSDIRYDAFYAYSYNLTKEQDRIIELKNTQEIVDTIRKYENVATIEEDSLDICESPINEGFDYEITKRANSMISYISNDIRVLSDKPSYVYMISSKDFQTSQKIDGATLYCSEDGKTLYVALKATPMSSILDKRLFYDIQKKGTEIHPIFNIYTDRKYLDVSNIVFVKPNPVDLQFISDENKTAKMKIEEYQESQNTENPIFHISYYLNDESGEQETKTNVIFQRFEDNDETFVFIKKDYNEEGTEIKIKTRNITVLYAGNINEMPWY